MRRRDLTGLPPETRAEVARRRLEQLTQSLAGPTDAEAGPGASEWPPAEPSAARAPRHLAAHVTQGRPRVTPTHLRVAGAGAVAFGVLLTWWLLAERPRSADVGDAVTLAGEAHEQPAGRASGAAPAPSNAGPQQVVVDVAGQVRRPGIVTLPAGSRVHEAIRRAGGLRPGVDTSSLNLARVLVDGEQVLVGVEAAAVPGGAGSGGAGGGPGAGPAGAPVSLNTATMEQLDALPGVGPVTAQHILDWRTQHGGFSSVDELLDVPGIGDKTLADLRDLVTV